MSALQPPRINTQDPGAHDVSESSDDHFSSASEGTPGVQSPTVPTTRVERVDDNAAYGEVPGTPAYQMREKDAVPDEVEIVPEGTRSRSGTTTRSRAASHLSSSSRPETPGGTPVPRTIVERVDDKPAYGEVDGTPAKDMRMADAMPDEVKDAPKEAAQRLEGRDGSDSQGGSEFEGGDEAVVETTEEAGLQVPDEQSEQEAHPAGDVTQEAQEDDDFDDFAEGDEDDDFGDFDEAEATPIQEPREVTSQPVTPNILAGLPPLDLTSCTTSADIESSISPYINAILPNSCPVSTDTLSLDLSKTSPFLSDRSLSLWQQLVSPPPMQPPNWTRSRIRRLFLVSLGVPVDLDEILPPSKQKRLVLPSIGLDGISPQPSPGLERVKGAHEGASTTSLDSKTGAPKSSSKSSKRPVPPAKGPPPPPEFDRNAASLRCSITAEAMLVYSDVELKEHVFTLETLNKRASQVLEYWLMRRDEGMREKEALEGVVANLVGFVKGRRGGK